MQISYKQPADRGVTQFTYVGDDQAVEKAVGDARDSHLMFGAVAALIAWQSHGVTRLGALGVLGYIAYKAAR